KEAATPAFKKYGQQVIKNAKVLADELTKNGFDLVSGGTDNHLILIDLRNKGINGKLAAYALEVANIVINMNGVPFDTNPPLYPSGIRLGPPAITTRGMKEKEMKQVAMWITRAINAVSGDKLPTDKEQRIAFVKDFKLKADKNKELLKIAAEVKSLTKYFPLP
ncbi:MAG TPA: hypothetical protein VLE91_03480, partial [Candidatus Saccharimonadales bacterium]|nr:hypothetical protein [Candidatus Saccharimonadales bacterium]